MSEPTGHCASCEHWVPFDPEDYPGMCGLALIKGNRLGLCRKISEEANRAQDMDNENASPDGTLALCADGSDYRHDMRTAAGFGCVLWEQKA